MTIQTLCESKELEYEPLMQAVVEFVDTVHDSPSPELYEATAKRLLGETLNHDEIMLGVPTCTEDDYIVISEDTYAGQYDVPADKEYGGVVFTDMQMKVMLQRLRLGRKGLKKLYKTYLQLMAKDPKGRTHFNMGKAARMMGVNPKEGQLILLKMIKKHELRKEYYLQLADSVLLEDTPTNTAGGGMPDHKPTDGKCDKGVVKRKKKLSDITK